MHSGGVENISPIGIAGRIYFIMSDGKILIEEKYKKGIWENTEKGVEYLKEAKK